MSLPYSFNARLELLVQEVSFGFSTDESLGFGKRIDFRRP